MWLLPWNCLLISMATSDHGMSIGRLHMHVSDMCWISMCCCMIYKTGSIRSWQPCSMPACSVSSCHFAKSGSLSRAGRTVEATFFRPVCSPTQLSRWAAACNP
ncbi:hypothetical protein FN846DRAFT_232743 [Sphaerosporella brunnea]|uniref:Secreted protein n=1 Tax=Sphaerosporella brunnea TaxID=1250544 RepID=A0A5J5EN98_9PEZI|nr:hypothetical protein FN846DRAFT_232743 [Sphaerosporella brunnea]